VGSQSAASHARDVILACLTAGAFALAGIGHAPTPVLFALVALAAVVAGVAPAAGPGAVVLALPYFYRPLADGSGHYAASELLLTAAVAGAVGRVAFAAFRDRASTASAALGAVWRICRSPLFASVLLLTIVGFVLALYPYDASHRADALREWRWTLLEPTAFVFLLLHVERRPQQVLRHTLAWCMVLGAAVASAHGLTDLLSGGGVEVEGVRRIGGPYPHPNALALYVVRGAAFGVGWFAFEQRARWLAGPLTAICMLAVATTFSRGAYLALAVAIVYVVWRAAPRLRWPTVAFGGAVLAATFVVAGQRMLNLFSGGSGSLRVDIWRASVRMIRDRPLFGYGPDQFLYAYSPRYVAPTAWAERFTSHPHDVLLDFWVRLGIIGAALAVVGILWCVSHAARAFRQTQPVDALHMAALAGLLAAITHGLVDNAYFLHDLAMSVWLLLWLAGSAPIGERLLEKGSGSVEGARGWRRRVHRFPSLRQPAG
jgi:putative inorganic carbon (HCO3(-)) transporter